MKTIILATALLVATALAENATDQSPGTGRIVNGVNAKSGQHPSIVSFWYKLKPKSHFCAGTIIHPEYVVTAAHCCEDTDPEKVEVRHGMTDLAASDYGVSNVAKFIIHENFSMDAVEVNDIAMVKLKEKIFFLMGRIGLAMLPPKDFKLPENNRKATTAGWGLEKTGGSIQRHLQEADLIVLSDQECKRRTHGATTSKQFCCVDSDDKNKACSGDSGGPLFYNNNTIIGMLSFVFEPCQMTPYPSVFTSIMTYISWMGEIMGKN